MDPELTRLQMDVLKALRDSGPTHVYELKRQIGSRSVYAAVTSLQVKGMLVAEWEKDPPPNRPPRKIVKLTALGERALAGDTRTIRATSRPAVSWT